MKDKEDEKLLTLLVYKDTKDHTIDFPIASYTIPNDIHENFKLPENTEKIIIQELDYNGEYFKDKELLTVYLGEEKMLNEIFFSHKEIILDAKTLKKNIIRTKRIYKKSTD